MTHVIFTSIDASSSKLAVRAESVDCVDHDKQGFVMLCMHDGSSYIVVEKFDVVVARLNGATP